MELSKVLVINPNSSVSMTDEIRKNIENVYLIKARVLSFQVEYFTGPPSSPSQIDGIETSLQSTKECLPYLIEPESKYYYQKFHGILVACFSDHPLVHELINFASKAEYDVPIIGLLNSSIQYCTLLENKNFSIITSNKEWVDILNKSVEENFITESIKKQQLWRGTISTELQVLDLHSKCNYQGIINIIKSENIERLKSKIIILGCAAFSSLTNDLTATFKQDNIEFIDTIILGINTLISLIEYRKL
ncbi:Dcg1p NDAI_0F00980 [Naumovozyma dairenensis CBS 421]|uniref:Uncharacterized protein n=1 Tax=Naumovozyma dairenensis (strain ATCC 10597 / BCRC 20456 / CBS 421 / NBRC 0211 / NRRL Y-12639) TaxID=1071378 RepID=G0WCA6_NAUDC|nr:hypothetical protein NDAI_0F00980 [Naumovozyma dairenensis CBS 421]CCD25417.1 hypothetical protein NDAI_0F00980 [Naumovozyma dairenensis CBS 421]